MFKANNQPALTQLVNFKPKTGNTKKKVNFFSIDNQPDMILIEISNIYIYLYIRHI